MSLNYNPPFKDSRTPRTNWNPSGQQRPSRFRLVLLLFVLVAVLIFMFAILSQPISIIGDVLEDAYPEGDDYTTGGEYNSQGQLVLGLALGAAVVIGIIFLFAFYGLRYFGGGRPGSFG